MLEDGRKLTIRLPDTPPIGEARVDAVHVDPGGWVVSGSPVMTVRGTGGVLLVRAPRSGRVTSLVGVGDAAAIGDSLFLLAIDETSPLQRLGPRRVASDDTSRGDRPWRPDLGVDGFWRMAARFLLTPELETVLYAIGAAAALPVLHALDWRLDFAGLAAAGIGILALAMLVQRLYVAEDVATLRRFTLPAVMSWIAISAIAIFDRPPLVDADGIVATASAVAGDHTIDPGPVALAALREDAGVGRAAAARDDELIRYMPVLPEATAGAGKLRGVIAPVEVPRREPAPAGLTKPHLMEQSTVRYLLESGAAAPAQPGPAATLAANLIAPASAELREIDRVTPMRPRAGLPAKLRELASTDSVQIVASVWAGRAVARTGGVHDLRVPVSPSLLRPAIPPAPIIGAGRASFLAASTQKDIAGAASDRSWSGLLGRARVTQGDAAWAPGPSLLAPSELRADRTHAALATHTSPERPTIVVAIALHDRTLPADTIGPAPGRTEARPSTAIAPPPLARRPAIEPGASAVPIRPPRPPLRRMAESTLVGQIHDSADAPAWPIAPLSDRIGRRVAP